MLLLLLSVSLCVCLCLSRGYPIHGVFKLLGRRRCGPVGCGSGFIPLLCIIKDHHRRHHRRHHYRSHHHHHRYHQSSVVSGQSSRSNRRLPVRLSPFWLGGSYWIGSIYTFLRVAEFFGEIFFFRVFEFFLGGFLFLFLGEQGEGGPEDASIMEGGEEGREGGCGSLGMKEGKGREGGVLLFSLFRSCCLSIYLSISRSIYLRGTRRGGGGEGGRGRRIERRGRK